MSFMSVNRSNPFSAVGQATCSTSAGRHSAELDTPGTSEKEVQNRNEDKKVTLVVERPKEHLKRTPLDFSSNAESNDRCERMGLGSSPRRADNTGSLVQARGKKGLKLEGIKGYLSKPPADPKRTACPGVLGQHDNSIITNKIGWHKEQDPDGTISPNTELGRGQFGLAVHSPSEGHGKHFSRPSQQK